MKVIVAYHYIRLLQDAELISCTTIPLPVRSVDEVNLRRGLVPADDPEESQSGEKAYPKHCTQCGSDELTFYRIEERNENDDNNAPTKVFPVFHVKCCKCGGEGTLEKFQ